MTAPPDSRFYQSLANPAEFTLTFELVPSRGGRSKEHARTLELARHAAADHRLQAVSITENAGGHAALSPEVLGLEIRAMGLEVITHFSCKDKNRNQMESQLFAWDRMGLRDLLVITGDYPKVGYQGFPKPVFDLDSVHALDLISRMNEGRFSADDPLRQRAPIHPTGFVKGVALSPFKRLEAELVMQYTKLHRKVAAGADFIITQLGFDARKFEEVLSYLRHHGLDLPVLGNVFIPNLPVAGLMHQGKIPGCIITDELYEVMQQEAKGPDKGKKARLIRAAQLLSILKGLGYAGAHIGGPGLSYRDIEFVLDEAEKLAPDWRALIPALSFWHRDGWYYFAKDEATGLNRPEPAPRTAKSGERLPYRLARATHNLAFTPTGPLYQPMKKLCLALADGPLANFLDHSEHVLKFLMFGCQHCGDCTLAELAFACPQSGCAKYLLNGACGGSRDGWCEVYPGRKRCLYVRIYERLQENGLVERLKTGLVPPRNWALNNSSSWVNFYRGLDHTGKAG